jgi:NitT/TauT family transport system substrate-binding protein
VEIELRVAVISDGFPLWPLHIAQSVGLFEAEGLKVAVTVTGSSAKQMEALSKGDFDIGIQLPDHVVRAVNRGSDLFAFMAPAHAADISLIAARGVHSLSDLKGKTIAVDGARSGYALLLRRMLRAHGLADADCPLTEFGGTKERVEALTAKRADAAFVNPPFDRALLAKGFVRLASTLEAFPGYPGPVAATRRSWADSHDALLVRFVRAYRNALNWLSSASNRQAAVDIACATLPVDQGAAAAAWEELTTRPEPVLSTDGFRQVIDVVWEGDGLTSPKPGAEKFIDLRYVNHASRS